MRQKTRNAFTLVEFLFVVAVIAILALIALPNFFETSTRSPVSRAKADMRSMATGIESYFVDNNVYPASIPLSSYAKKASRSKLERVGVNRLSAPSSGSNTLTGLTTPISYITSLFPDPFSPNRELPYAYHAHNGGWIVFSPGPDEVYDLVPEIDYEGDTTTAVTRLAPKTYDPTNGTKSGGDVWRIKQ